MDSSDLRRVVQQISHRRMGIELHIGGGRGRTGSPERTGGLNPAATAVQPISKAQNDGEALRGSAGRSMPSHT